MRIVGADPAIAGGGETVRMRCVFASIVSLRTRCTFWFSHSRSLQDTARITGFWPLLKHAFEAFNELDALFMVGHWHPRYSLLTNSGSLAMFAAIRRVCGTPTGECELSPITGCGSAKASVAERPI